MAKKTISFHVEEEYIEWLDNHTDLSRAKTMRNLLMAYKDFAENNPDFETLEESSELFLRVLQQSLSKHKLHIEKELEKVEDRLEDFEDDSHQDEVVLEVELDL